MRPLPVIEVENAAVDSMPDPVPSQKSAPITRRAGVLQILIDVKDALLLKMRSRKLTERERRQLHQDIAKDPEVERALGRALAAHPQYRRKARNQGGLSDKHG